MHPRNILPSEIQGISEVLAPHLDQTRAEVQQRLINAECVVFPTIHKRMRDYVALIYLEKGQFVRLKHNEWGWDITDHTLQLVSSS